MGWKQSENKPDPAVCARMRGEVSRAYLRRTFRLNSLWIIMAGVILAITLAAIIAITQIVYHYADDVINQSIAQSNEEITANAVTSINSYVQEMVTVADDVEHLLKTYSLEELNTRLFVLLRNDIETIAVFDKNDIPVLTTGSSLMRDDISLTRQSWFDRATPGGDGYLLSQPHVQRLYAGKYPWVITLTRSVSWHQDGIQQTGVLMVDMNFNRIRDLCARDVENAGYLYLVDAMGEIVYHPKQQMIYAGILPNEITAIDAKRDETIVTEQNGTVLSVCTQALTGVSWSVKGVAELNGLATYDAGPGAFVVMAILLLSMAVLVGSLLLARLVVRPLHRLAVLMERVSDAGETVLAPENGIYEAGQLGAAFNRMTIRIQNLMEQIRTEQKQLHRSEMKALNAQINPHFLYNTLDSVVWLAESGDERGVVQMVLALSKYFRLSLSGAKDFITVGDELKQIENYLVIQKMRFGDAFTYEIKCRQEVCDVKIPKIILQPIVENSIVHGIGTMGEGGHIQIEAFQKEHELYLSVSDNGCGMKAEVVAEILRQKRDAHSGIGLKNVNQRIQLLFGASYGVQVESELDEGTTVKVCLPMEPAQTTEEAGR